MPKRREREDRRKKLMAGNVGTLPAVDGRRTLYTDTVTPNFRLAVSPSGIRTYFVTYVAGRRVRKYRVARVGELTLADAREQALKILAAARLGNDPQAEKLQQRRRPEGLTFADLVSAYVKVHGANMRPRSLAEFQRTMKADVLPAFGDKVVQEIGREDVRLLLTTIAKRGARTQEWRSFAYASAVFNWGRVPKEQEVEPLLPEDFIPPTITFKPPKGKRRSTTYSNDELRTIFGTVPGTDMVDLVPLILHTATRSEETRAMKWSDLDFERALWTIPPEAGKGKDEDEPHPVPLSTGAKRILARIRERQQQNGGLGVFVFPAPTGPCNTCGLAGHMDEPGNAMRRLKKASGIDVRLHDMRRTVSDRLERDLGVSGEAIEAVLGHSRDKLTRTYRPERSLREVRAGLEAWSVALDNILSGREESKVENLVVGAFGR